MKINKAEENNQQYNTIGQRIGYWEIYYITTDGESHLSRNGNYIDGLKDGLWKFYNSNGNVWYKGTYNNGIRTGLWQFYEGDGINPYTYKQVYFI